jgi:hypothetical protein
MEVVMAEIRNGWRRTVLIHTTFYMKTAIAVYTAFGFGPCSPFRDTPEHVRHTDVFMSLSLPPQTTGAGPAEAEQGQAHRRAGSALQRI